jgi:ABC-2 type transport system permease protein
MISLESKSFNILKSLPIKPFHIVLYKVLTALVIMIPCILIGDIIIFIKFKFNTISILLLLIASILLPAVSELLGILINLKYPKLDATNDTEIVKQSMSSMISVFTGMGLIGITLLGVFYLLDKGLNGNIIILLFLIIYGIIVSILCYLLNKKTDKYFNNITT